MNIFMTEMKYQFNSRSFHNVKHPLTGQYQYMGHKYFQCIEIGKTSVSYE
jgi:hypothetical protein